MSISNILGFSDNRNQLILLGFFFNKCIKLNPNTPDAYNNISLVYLAQKKIDLALNSLKKALEIAPSMFGIYNNIGLIFINLKNYPEAILNFKKVIEGNPNSYDAYNNIALALFHLEKYNEALKELEEEKKEIVYVKEKLISLFKSEEQRDRVRGLANEYNVRMICSCGVLRAMKEEKMKEILDETGNVIFKVDDNPDRFERDILITMTKKTSKK
jgi:tetratricopeptide (TPR) repeat protein